MSKYVLVCPSCRHSREVRQEDLREVFNHLRPMNPEDENEPFTPPDTQRERTSWPFGDEQKKGESGISHQRRFEGKNATQIAYLTKLEARERELESQQETEDASGYNDTPNDDEISENSESIDDIHESTIRAREVALEARTMALEAREKAVETREAVCLLREKALDELEKNDHEIC